MELRYNSGTKTQIFDEFFNTFSDFRKKLKKYNAEIPEIPIYFAKQFSELSERIHHPDDEISSFILRSPGKPITMLKEFLESPEFLEYVSVH